MLAPSQAAQVAARGSDDHNRTMWTQRAIATADGVIYEDISSRPKALVVSDMAIISSVLQHIGFETALTTC